MRIAVVTYLFLLMACSASSGTVLSSTTWACVWESTECEHEIVTATIWTSSLCIHSSCICILFFCISRCCTFFSSHIQYIILKTHHIRTVVLKTHHIRSCLLYISQLYCAYPCICSCNITSYEIFYYTLLMEPSVLASVNVVLIATRCPLKLLVQSL